MKATCILCDRIDDLDKREFKTKQLRNKPIRMYICPDCDHRVAIQTMARINSGKFHFNKPFNKPLSQLKREILERESK
ncbi:MULTISPECIES: YlaI family protein [Listeria]|uniref:YlaI family protein n=1 Tax=Listeria TaxID=1637 RepID=UPI000B5930C2|nr:MULTISPECIES: YlaI family protein [Listeria]